MKKHTFFSTVAIVALLLSITFAPMAQAQVPGTILSAGALGGEQGSSITGLGNGRFFAVRGSFSMLFAEIRMAQWSGKGTSLSESGILAGADASLFHIMVSASGGLGNATYQHAPVDNVTQPSLRYSTFIYDAQAMYQLDLISDMLTVGAGVNYIGESNSIAPINGWGWLLSVNVGL